MFVASHLPCVRALPSLLSRTTSRFIFTAIYTYDQKRLVERLQQDPKCVNELYRDKSSPLHYLAGSGPSHGIQLPVKKEPPRTFTRILLSHVKHVDPVDAYGETPLSVAARAGRVDVSRQLLRNGADPNGVVKTPLQSMLLSTVVFDPSFAIGRLLLKKGADIHRPNQEDLSPLFALLYSVKEMEKLSKVSYSSLYNFPRVSLFHFDHLYQKMEWLLQNGAKVIDKKGDLLEICLKELDPRNPTVCKYLRPLVPLLLKYHNSDPTKVDEKGWTLLHWAVFRDCYKGAAELHRRGFKADQRAMDGVTPYQLALVYQQSALLRLFNPYETVDEQYGKITPLNQFTAKMALKLPCVYRIAFEYQYSRHTLYAIERESSESDVMLTPMTRAIRNNDLEEVTSLLEGGWNVRIENEFVQIASRKNPNVKNFLQICKDHFESANAEFYKALFKRLDASETSGLTLSSLCQSFLFGDRWERVHSDLVIAIFDAGLKPQYYQQQTGENLYVEALRFRAVSYDDDHGYFEFPSFEGANAVMIELQRRGWDKNA